MLSITGGEPLLHNEFLAEWLPFVRNRFTIYLETNGIHNKAMEKLRALIDIVSLDFKLPSATGLSAFWEEHRRFLAAAGNENVFVKAVVTSDTIADDIVESANIIAQIRSFYSPDYPAGGRTLCTGHVAPDRFPEQGSLDYRGCARHSAGPYNAFFTLTRGYYG